MQQQVLRDDGIHNPHQRQRERGDDALLLCDHLEHMKGQLNMGSRKGRKLHKSKQGNGMLDPQIQHVHSDTCNKTVHHKLGRLG